MLRRDCYVLSRMLEGRYEAKKVCHGSFSRISCWLPYKQNKIVIAGFTWFPSFRNAKSLSKAGRTQQKLYCCLKKIPFVFSFLFCFAPLHFTARGRGKEEHREISKHHRSQHCNLQSPGTGRRQVTEQKFQLSKEKKSTPLCSIVVWRGVGPARISSLTEESYPDAHCRRPW